MAPTLTLHHGENKREFVEHPVEVTQTVSTCRQRGVAAVSRVLVQIAVRSLTTSSFARHFQLAPRSERPAPNGSSSFSHQSAVPGSTGVRQPVSARVGKPPARSAQDKERDGRPRIRTGRDLAETLEMSAVVPASLEHCEAIIDRGLATFIEVGAASHADTRRAALQAGAFDF